MLRFISKITNVLSNFQDISLLLSRFTLSYGFYETSMNKWLFIPNVAEWFDSMNIPFPLFNTYLVATIESLGVILLFLGLFTRIISLPLIFIMIVAITNVHLQNGFSAGNNGFEIPLYYFLFLSIFASFGAGKYSLDYLLFRQDGL